MISMKTLSIGSLGSLELFSRLLGAERAARMARETYRILVINPGSTSTKLAYFEGVEKRAEFEVHIDADVEDGADSRAATIREWLAEQSIEIAQLDGLAARGGLFQPVPGGTYPLSEAMLADIAHARLQHAANLAVPIAITLRECAGLAASELPITVTDPAVIDEVEITSRMTGLREIKTDGTLVHYLNHRAVIRLAAWEFGLDPNEASVVSAHLGGGFSVIRHHRGRAVKVINAFSGLPASNRSGNLPVAEIILGLRERKYELERLSDGVFREGGLLSLAGTNDFKTLLEFKEHGATAEQVEKIDLVLGYFAQRIAEGILSASAGWGRPDFACITGGLSRSDPMAELVERRIGGLLPLVRVPGSLEQESLAAGMALALMEPDSLLDYAQERDRLHAYRSRENHLIDRPVFQRKVLRRREGSPIRTLEELIQATRNRVHRHFVPTIAIAGADNEDALEAARRACEEGEYKIARFLLVGDEQKIRRQAALLAIDLDGDDFEIIPAADPVARCLELYAEDRCQVLMKGSVKTEEILAPTFRWLKERGRLPAGALFSAVAVFPKASVRKLLLLSDPGINIDPDKEKKKRILENALFVARSLNLPVPKVAMISAIEQVNPRIESSVEAAEIAADYANRSDCLVEGPLSFDVAVNPEVAAEKGYKGQIQGNADILIMPGIDSGNTVYKSLTSSGLSLAGAIVGCGIPIVLTSRSDSALTKLATIALCLRLYFIRKQEELEREPGPERAP